MSKFLKFIVHFFVICTIVCVLGLALPPFFGVRTVIMDSSDKATNLPVGSVTYAIPVKNRRRCCGNTDSCPGRWKVLSLQSGKCKSGK